MCHPTYDIMQGHTATKRAINELKQLKISTSNFRDPLCNTQPVGMCI